MEMTIDNAILQLEECKAYKQCDTEKDLNALDVAITTMRKYQQLQNDYENRLKADLVAMLTDIQLEIEELDTPNNGSAYIDCVEIIQQKINELEGEQDPTPQI